MKCFILRYGCAMFIAVTLGLVGLSDADAQDTIDLVPFGADFDYLFTLQDVDSGDGTGQRWQAFDPTYDPTFYTGDGGSGIGGIPVWALLDYDTSDPAGVGAVKPNFAGATQLQWRNGPSPIHYSEIAYLAANGITGTDLQASEANGGVGFDEAAADGEKWTHYFRAEFETANPLSELMMEVVVDDDAIFYIDGLKIGDWNCCDNDPRRQELIDAGIPPEALREYELNGIDTGQAPTEGQINTPAMSLDEFGGTLTPGTHVLGVEVHQGNRTSSDMSMYVRLFANDVPTDTVCDFDGNSICDLDDINALMNEVAAGTNTASFDLNGDNLVNDDDRDAWLATAATENGLSAPYLQGDTNLDLHVDVSDLNNVGLAWRSASNNWSEGNLTGAGVDSADLNVVGLNWQTWHPDAPMAGANAVPEPAGLVLMAIAGLAMIFRRDRSGA